MNGYNFTERVRKVLAMAREEAARLHHEYVGTEHILLGLIREGEGVAATVLQNLSVELDDLQQKIEETVKKGRPDQTFAQDLPYSSRGKKVLELAMDEARVLEHSYVGTEHLLLGLLREKKGVAAQVLNVAGVNLDAARAETLRILGTATTLGPQEQRHTYHTNRPRPGGTDDPPRFFVRLRRVIADAHSVAANRNASSVTPAHLAIALLQHGEGMANAALDKLRLDRTSTISALYEHAPLVAAPTGTNAITARSCRRRRDAGGRSGAASCRVGIRRHATLAHRPTHHIARRRCRLCVSKHFDRRRCTTPFARISG